MIWIKCKKSQTVLKTNSQGKIRSASFLYFFDHKENFSTLHTALSCFDLFISIAFKLSNIKLLIPVVLA